MTYTVVWLPDAEDELAALWLDAHNRDAVTRVSDVLDRRLQLAVTSLQERFAGGGSGRRGSRE
jgi:hypothetical protein